MAGTQYTRERLVEAAASCSDIDEVIVFFGTPPYGNLRRYLHKRFEHFGIDISHFPRGQRGRSFPSDQPLTSCGVPSLRASPSPAP